MSDDDGNVIEFPVRPPAYPPGPQVGDVVVGGRYTLAECLGEGGLGRVFLANDASGFRRVAVKTLVPRYIGHRQREQRLFDEYRYLERIQDRRHLVAGIECGRLSELDGWPFLVMEHVNGISLFRRMLQAKRITPTEILEIALQTARGIQAIHHARVVHRDITPQNILLLESGPRLHVKIIDFSHGADADAPRLPAGDEGRLTGMHEVPGTPQYMPPEQASARAADPRMDVYSFGVVLYELITGRNPFAGMSRDVYIGLQRQEALQVDPLDPRVHPDLPESLLRLVGRCLRESPAGRPAIESIVRRLEAMRGEEEHAEVGRVQPLPVRPVPVVGEVASFDELDADEGTAHEPRPTSPELEARPGPAVVEPEPVPAAAPTEASAADEGAPAPAERPSWVAVAVPAALVVLLTVTIIGWLWNPTGESEPQPAAAPPPAAAEPSEGELEDVPPTPVPEAPRGPEPVAPPQAEGPREPVTAPPAGERTAHEAPPPAPSDPEPRSTPGTRRRSSTAAGGTANAKARCEDVVETARAARANHDWKAVVKHTRERACWASAPDQRLAWRVEALSELRRWEDCAQLGDQTEDARARFLADACRARLAREEAR